MDTDEQFWMLARQSLSDDGSMIPTSRDKVLVAQHLRHQFGKEVSIDVIILGDAIRKSRAGDRWHNHIKRGVGIIPIFGRIGKPLNHLLVAIEGIGKAVQQEQRRW